MNKDFENLYVDKYKESFFLLERIDSILYDSVSLKLNEKIWSKMPMYYSNDKSIILALFSDYINIVSNPQITHAANKYQNAILNHISELKDYKITPKGMLQIYIDQEIPEKVLKKIFKDNFEG